ncbi:LrgB family protein [Bacillus sp. DNRA2]|uniref:LrgB family protein n=1 Tax=Bacillus sp. DNRA2 TaxID=2723053 RepID=UPI00145DD32B|nr:LrgB family protein [Bacillus sp. DNRA2]NMD69932.1 LrgB family protein [Bacillus sp. DNRA2]
MSTIITTYSIILTVIVYFFVRKISVKYPSPFTTPVFLGTSIVIIILLASSVNYQQYEPAKEIMTYLLGPATVALAVPIYRNRSLLKAYLIPALVGLTTGTIVTVLLAIYLAKMFHLAKYILASLSIKSVTIPVASEVSKIIGGDTILVAGIVMITGMLGAMFGPWLMNLLKINHPFARGLAIGSMAHGIGTAEVAKEGELQGAVAGVAMGVAAVLISTVLPFAIPYLL